MLISLTMAAWLGLLTSVSPCPLATNIAAVTLLSQRIGNRLLAVAGAVAYALGRASIYTLIGLLISWGGAAAPKLSEVLQQSVAPFIGPVLIVVGLLLLGWISLPIQFGLLGHTGANRFATFGLPGEFLLGMAFALTFCPVSAALFFGTLLPLALAAHSAWAVCMVYGIATAIPVGLLAVLIALGAHSSRKILDMVQKRQDLVAHATGAVIVLVGVWLTLELCF